MDNATQSAEPVNKHRILIVDDDVDFAVSLREIVESRGECEAMIAANREQARAVLDSFLPAVALIDVRLGKDNGADLLVDFAAHPAAPVCVMITGYASTESAVNALHAGAYDYLTKPIRPQTLFATLRRCFDRIRLEQERSDALSTLATRNLELERVNRRLHRVVECMGEMTSSTSVVELCRLVLEQLARHMGVDGGSIYLREGDRLVLVHTLDPGHAANVIPMPLNADSVLGRVVESAEAVLVTDAASSDGLMLSGWSGYRDQSLLALPLVGQDKVVHGVLSLHTKQLPPFTPQDCEIGRIMLALCSETLRVVKAREELQESETMLQLIINSEPECVKVLDRELNLVQMNPAGLAMIEADSIDQVAGKGVAHLIDAENREAFQDLSERVLAGESGTLEYGLTGMKGTPLRLETHKAPLRDGNGEIIGLLGITRDITERNKLQEQTRRQELQLIQANKMTALGTLVAGVAHEINNPNQTIQINAGLMVEVWNDAQKILDRHAEMHGEFDLCGLPYSKVKASYNDLTRDIKDGAEQIRIVVDRLRTFARPHGGIYDQARGERIQVKDAVLSALALLKHSIQKGTDNFSSKLADDLPEIHGNKQKFQQIIINLLLNSLESLADKSSAVVVEARLDEKQQRVLLIVRDEGIGIHEDNIGRALEPFYTTKRNEGGSGLGLSITDSLVRELGGEMFMESELGTGTCTTVSIPALLH